MSAIKPKEEKTLQTKALLAQSHPQDMGHGLQGNTHATNAVSSLGGEHLPFCKSFDGELCSVRQGEM